MDPRAGDCGELSGGGVQGVLPTAQAGLTITA
jgi:hypothetical protein